MSWIIFWIVCLFLALLLLRLWYFSQRVPLRGRRVLISGCDRGLGRALAIHLVQHGAQVFAGCLDSEAVREIEGEVAALMPFEERAAGIDSGSSDRPGQMHAFQLDVTCAKSIAKAVAFVARTPPLSASSASSASHCCLDALINNAGTMSPSSLVELTPLSSYERNIDVNFLGSVALTQACLSMLRARGAIAPRIVFISSFLGRVAPFSLSAYSCSKFALEAFADSLRAELLSQGIHVSIVEPGSMQTKMGEEMKAGMESVWNDAAAQTRERLGEKYQRAMQRSAWMFDLLGRDVSTLFPALLSSVCARWPRSRYVCGWDSWLFGVVAPLFPARLNDLASLVVLGWPRPSGREEEEEAAAASSSAESGASDGDKMD